MAETTAVKGPDIDECRATLEAARREMAESFARLREHNLNPLDYRAWVQRHPFGVTLGAVAAGFLLASPAGSDTDGRATVLGELSRSGMATLLPILIRSLASEE